MQTKPVPDGNVGIQIRRIKPISFTINEAAAKVGSAFKIDFNKFINVNLEQNLLFFTIRVFYHYEDKLEKPEDLLLDFHLQNVFQVYDLPKYVNNEIEISFPQDVWLTIVSLSITHARALISQYVAGTTLQDSIIPIINAELVAKAFFPDSFKEIDATAG